MFNKIINIEDAADKILDGMTVMVGGFMGCGSPHNLIDLLVQKKVKNLTVICSDSGLIDYGIGKLVANKQIKKLYASHIGLNPETCRQLNDSELDVVLIPQGTFAERIRCGGAGIGGFLTPTGLGTTVAEGKEIITINEKEYLLELPLHADVALIAGYKVDRAGNVYYKGSTRNFNPLMATAADTVIVEAEHLVNIGEIEQEAIATPCIFIDYIVEVVTHG